MIVKSINKEKEGVQILRNAKQHYYHKEDIRAEGPLLICTRCESRRLKSQLMGVVPGKIRLSELNYVYNLQYLEDREYATLPEALEAIKKEVDRSLIRWGKKGVAKLYLIATKYKGNLVIIRNKETEIIGAFIEIGTLRMGMTNQGNLIHLPTTGYKRMGKLERIKGGTRKEIGYTSSGFIPTTGLGLRIQTTKGSYGLVAASECGTKLHTEQGEDIRCEDVVRIIQGVF